MYLHAFLVYLSVYFTTNFRQRYKLTLFSKSDILMAVLSTDQGTVCQGTQPGTEMYHDWRLLIKGSCANKQSQNQMVTKGPEL